MIRNHHNYYVQLWSIMGIRFFNFIFNQKLRFHWFVKRSLILIFNFQFSIFNLLTVFRFTVPCKVKVITVKVSVQL